MRYLKILLAAFAFASILAIGAHAQAAAAAPTNTCILYGTTSWVGVNLLIILLTITLAGAVFAAATIFSSSFQSKIKQAAKSEITQALISAVIIVLLVGAATTACAASTSISNTLTKTSMNPFQYSEYYIGNLSSNTGLNLLTTAYSTSVQYAVEASVLQSLGEAFGAPGGLFIPQIAKLFALGGGGFFTISLSGVVQLNTLFSFLSGLLLNIIAPLITIAVGLLFLQFIMLPVLQYTAFSIILPVAIGMRSLAFLGNNLRYASNALLALAIAAYIIYPVMIAFNGYIVSWIFSAQNPSYQYLQSTYLIPNILPNQYFSTNGISGSYTGFWGTIFQKAFSIFYGTPSVQSQFITSAFSQAGGIIIWPPSIMAEVQTLVNETAQFLFVGVVLIIIDLAVTLGFAIGLQKALNGGIEGAGSFWSGL
jgi:hypothetical protein